MDHQDQTRTHTEGDESHGVHGCQKCGRPFPNPHPSAKHRRAHKRICGTTECYKLLVSEGQTHSNASDDEHLSDDDRKTQGPSTLDIAKNEKGSGRIGEKLSRSGEDVFSDTVADFSDGGLSPGNKERLQDGLDSAIHVERGDRKCSEFSGASSEDNGINDASQLIAESRDDDQMQNPKILQGERFEDGNTLELQGQLPASTVDPLSGSFADLRTGESTVAHGDDCFGVSSDVAHKETNLKGKDEIKSDRDMVEIVISSDNTVGETCEGVSKVAVRDVVNLDCQVADRASNLKEKNSAESLSVMAQDDPSLEINSTVSTNTSTNDIQVQSAHGMQFATSSDVKMLQERGEGNVSAFTFPPCDDRRDLAHPEIEYEDLKDHGVVTENSLSLRSSQTLKHERDDLKDTVTEENNFHINPGPLSEKSEVASLDMQVLDSSMKKEQVNCERMAEESIEVSLVKITVESSQRLDETGAPMNAMKTKMNESHMVHLSEEQGSDDACINSQWLSLAESNFMASSNENPSDASFGSATRETSVISIENVSRHEKNSKEINYIAIDGKCGGVTVKNDIGIGMKPLQPSNLQSEVKPSSDAFNSDDIGEMGKIDKCALADAQYTEGPIVKDTSLPKGIECTNKSRLLGAQEDIKDDDINSNGRVNEECDRFRSTSAYSHQSQDAEPLVKAAEDIAGNYSSLSSLNIEATAKCVSAVEDTREGEPGRELSDITAVPIQDQSRNNEAEHASSAIYTSVDSGSRSDSLKANWGSVSVHSMQSDLQAVIDVEAAPSEAGKSDLKDNPTAASESQQREKPEMFEPPSFMTWVEPGHMVGRKAAASEVEKGPNQQHPSSTSSQDGWFPTLTQVTNESQGRKRNEEIIAKVTRKQHTPLKSPLGEAVHSNKPKSPKLEENSVKRKNGKLPEDNGSGLTTVNSILGPESPAAQAVKGEGGKEWNSPARYPAEIKRKKKKVKSRPFWIQFVCCSSVDPQRS